MGYGVAREDDLLGVNLRAFTSIRRTSLSRVARRSWDSKSYTSSTLCLIPNSEPFLRGRRRIDGFFRWICAEAGMALLRSVVSAMERCHRRLFKLNHSRAAMR